MAGMGVEVKIDKEYAKILRAFERASAPRLLELADFAGGALDRVSKQAFERQQDPVSGEKWEPLKRPRPDGTTDSILWPHGEHGQLYRSLIWEAFSDGSVIYGSNMVYARIHQLGGDTGRGKIPARPYMGIPSGFVRGMMGDPAVADLLGLGDAL